MMGLQIGFKNGHSPQVPPQPSEPQALGPNGLVQSGTQVGSVGPVSPPSPPPGLSERPPPPLCLLRFRFRFLGRFLASVSSAPSRPRPVTVPSPIAESRPPKRRRVEVLENARVRSSNFSSSMFVP